MAVITARARDKRGFRRCGVAWTTEFQTVRVSPEDAMRIAAERKLEVKPEEG